MGSASYRQAVSSEYFGSARATFDQQSCDRTVTRLGEQCAERLEDLADRPLLAELKADPGQVGLETLLRKIDKLTASRSLWLPAHLFVDDSGKLVEGGVPAPPAATRPTCGRRRGGATDPAVGVVSSSSDWASPRCEG